MKHLVYFILFISTSFISCKEYPCSQASGNISITGFTINETDTIIVRKFAKSTNFSTPLATFVLDSLNSSFLRKANVLEIYGSIAYGTDNGLLSKYDYEIYLPSPNRVFQISEITEEQKTKKAGFSMEKSGCINPITSFKVNGSLKINDYYSSYLISVSK
jgi:hypothetical protein